MNSRMIPIAAIAAGVWALTFLPGLWSGAGAWAIRALCVALWLWLAVVLFPSSSKRPAVIAPLFLMVTSALWFYGILPVVFSTAIVEKTSSILNGLSTDTFPHLYSKLIRSEGELSILRFVLAGIAVMAWTAPGEKREDMGNGPDASALPPRWMVLLLGICAAAIYWIAGHMPLEPAQSSVKWLILQIRFAAMIFFLIAVALAASRVMVRSSGALIDFIVLVVVATAPVLSGGMKTVVYILGVSMLAMALARRSILAMGVMVIAPLALLLLGTIARIPEPSITNHFLARLVVTKVVVRQIESVDCLTGAIRGHDAPRANAPHAFYFASGLVPRFLWPEKPDLSQSGKTVLQYCDSYMAQNLHTGHSAAGTLLWEPLVQGGKAGQIAAQALTFIVLAGLSRVWIGGGPYAAAGILALVPWAVDFDQHFALYLANLVKAGLVVTAGLFLMAWGRRFLR